MSATDYDRTWVVCGMDGYPLTDEKTDKPKEFKTEKAAVARAKEHVSTTQDDEAWIYLLSHVVRRPTGDPLVDVVK